MAKKGESMILNNDNNGGSDVYLVETPVPNYNGNTANVQFAYGKAEVRDGWILTWFRENGYNVTKK